MNELYSLVPSDDPCLWIKFYFIFKAYQLVNNNPVHEPTIKIDRHPEMVKAIRELFEELSNGSKFDPDLKPGMKVQW